MRRAAADQRRAHARMRVGAHAARGQACASTSSRPSCCTNSAAAARSPRPTARSSPPAPTPACCTTAPTTRRLRDGDLVLIDAGCELDGYASDITRTFPANGRFTRPAARAVRARARRAGGGASTAPRPGARFNDSARRRGAGAGAGHARHRPARQTRSARRRRDRASAPTSPFYMHRTGHWLGMDVHDCGSYVEPTQGRVSERRTRCRRAIKNRPAACCSPAWC